MKEAESQSEPAQRYATTRGAASSGHGVQHGEYSIQVRPQRDLSLVDVASCAFLTQWHAELAMFAEDRALGDAGLQFAEAAAHPGAP